MDELFSRDDDAYRELTDRCGCSTDVFEDSVRRLDFLVGEAERMSIDVEPDCAERILEELEAPGCELEAPVPTCRVLVGDRDVGEPCTMGVWLDDCAPTLFCLTGSSGFPAEGTCVEQAALGESCESMPHSCAEGICVDDVCVLEAAQEGDPCWLQCGPGLLCKDEVCQVHDKCDLTPGWRP